MSAIEIPGYKIIRTLGVGGQATVYLAIQTGFEREVALKIMSPILASDPTFGERFIREAKIVAKLSHKSIVTVYDAGESGNFYYLAMEYMPGGDLKKRIENGMKARECLNIISKLATALHFAHEKGYIHRDVKSENILFNSDGDLVLTDFGIAKASNSSTQMTQTGKLIGTPEYMSPEQCRGRKIDGRSDLYSLGIILYEMLTRHVPFTGEDSVSICIKHVTSPVPKLPIRLKHFQWLIDLLLAKDPDQRFQNGAELAKAVNEFKKTGNQTTDIGINKENINTDLNNPTTKTSTSKTGISKTSLAKTLVGDVEGDIDDEDEDEDINHDLDDSFYEEMHTEKRVSQTQTHSKKSHSLIISLIIVSLFSVGGYLTKDRWFDKTAQWVEVTFSGKKSPTNSKDSLVNSQSEPNKDISKTDKQSELVFSPAKVANNGETANEIANSELNSRLNNQFKNESSSSVTEDKQTKNEAAENGEKVDVTTLLENADRLIQFEPHTLNDLKQALKLITTVRVLDPNNNNANVLYQHILTLSLSQATMLAEKNNFEAVDDWLSLVENEQKDHTLLAGTKQTIEKLKLDYQSKEKERQLVKNEVTLLLDKASIAQQENRLSSPETNNAVYYYQKILELEPENMSAKKGLDTIENTYLLKTEEAINKKSFSLAKSLLIKYAALSKDDVNKNNLQYKISKGEQAYEAERKEQQRLAEIENAKKLIEKQRLEKLSDPMVQMQLRGILDGAKALEDIGSLVTPEINNALDKYNKALLIDENNLVAKAGITRIETIIVSKLKDAINQLDKEQSLFWLNQFRIFNPKSNQLESFEKSIIELQNKPLAVADEQTESIKTEGYSTPDNITENELVNASDKQNKPQLSEGKAEGKAEDKTEDKIVEPPAQLD